jgi:excinuclease ABC subunit A
MLYILDEPTTGLHLDDVKRLLVVINRLVDAGNTVVVVEHHLDVVRCADWVIDLGPEGGEEGGEIIAEGPPDVIAQTPGSYTGKFLAEALPKPTSRR